MTKRRVRSIERNLVSLSIAAASLLGALLIAMFGVQQALGSSLDRLRLSTLPAQQALTALNAAVADLFARDVRVLATATQAELAALRDRRGIDAGMARAGASLDAALPGVEGPLHAAAHSRRLATRTGALLAIDRELFESTARTHQLHEALNQRSAELQTMMQQLIQDARAVAGHARLDYVLQLRTLARAPSAAAVHEAVYGTQRLQQESAEQVVAVALHLGQLAGKIALVESEDELNSVIANELDQNLMRGRGHIRNLAGQLEAGTATNARARAMQSTFDSVAQRISATNDAESLVRLKRGMLLEVTRRSVLQGRILASVQVFARELAQVELAVSDAAARTSQRAGTTLWIVRWLTLLVLAAALGVGWRFARRLRESVVDLRAQNAQLELLSGDLKRMNEGLEHLVAERSAALVQREHAMRLVLDAMDEGLVSADLSGALTGDCSRASLAWFGSPAAGVRVWDYLLPDATALREQFRIGFEQASEDVLPFEVSVAIIPAHFTRDGRIFALSFRQILEGDRFGGILTVVKDVSAQIEAEKREREAREQHTVLANLLRDKQGFQVFVRECGGMVATLRALPERKPALRALHTLKGSTAVYGMESVASFCHKLEDRMADHSQSIAEPEAVELAALWRGRLGRLEDVLAHSDSLELLETDLAELVHGLQDRRDYSELLELVESWKWTKTSALLSRLASQVRELGKRLHKPVEVRLEHHDLCVMPGPLDDFWTALVHVTRNAVDHGIESEAERREAGKPAQATITLRTVALAGGGFAVEIEDDGGGIDFAALRRAAERANLKAVDEAELVEVMFQDGVTTQTHASETSGRGVGLAAAVNACRNSGGEVQVESRRTAGTTFRFMFREQLVRVRQFPPNLPRVQLSLRPHAATG